MRLRHFVFLIMRLANRGCHPSPRRPSLLFLSESARTSNLPVVRILSVSQRLLEGLPDQIPSLSRFRRATMSSTFLEFSEYDLSDRNSDCLSRGSKRSRACCKHESQTSLNCVLACDKVGRRQFSGYGDSTLQPRAWLNPMRVC
jgi:hypothetical protein